MSTKNIIYKLKQAGKLKKKNCKIKIRYLDSRAFETHIQLEKHHLRSFKKKKIHLLPNSNIMTNIINK